MKKDLIGTTTYTVYSNEANAQAEMPVWQVVNCLLDAASRHAEQHGFGYQALKSNNEIWVLARLVFEMNRYPKVDEVMQVETWVEGTNKHFSSRNFKMTDGNGFVLGFGRSVWSILNFETRESCDLTKYDGIGDFIVDYPCPIERPGRISAVADENPEDYRVRISDLDVNRHLTTTQYIAHLLDRFPLEKFDEERVDRFEVQFLNEVLYDERVLLLKQKIEKGEYALEMRNEQGVSCCKCKCVFVKNEPGEE